MKKVIVILNDGPSSPRSWNGLRVANGMMEVGMEVKIILLDDAVFCAKKGQKLPVGLEEQNLASKLTELSKSGIAVWACGTCMQAKGLTHEELTDGVNGCCMMDICNLINNNDNAMVF